LRSAPASAPVLDLRSALLSSRLSMGVVFPACGRRMKRHRRLSVVVVQAGVAQVRPAFILPRGLANSGACCPAAVRSSAGTAAARRP
jgi:hypothetical protein